MHARLADVHFPAADRIRVVLDNLSTHKASSVYQIFPACEARRILRRLEFHYVPKHASWLNMVEIEIGVLQGQCLDRRIETQDQLVSEAPPGSDSETPREPASNGCSQRRRAATNGPRLPAARLRSRRPSQKVIITVQRYWREILI